MRIGELARHTGVATKTLRFYEESGVLPEPDRDANGYRNYNHEFVDRINFVKDAQSAGLTLKEIANILELRDRGESTCQHTVELLDYHLADLDRQIAELERTRAHLVTMTRRARRMDPAECLDPNRCQTIASKN
ncbi:MAG: heavy metal-responsive transcriptional regulator [Acidimicrobiia bacterium]